MIDKLTSILIGRPKSAANPDLVQIDTAVKVANTLCSGLPDGDEGRERSSFPAG